MKNNTHKKYSRKPSNGIYHSNGIIVVPVFRYIIIIPNNIISEPKIV